MWSSNRIPVYIFRYLDINIHKKCALFKSGL
jgi:hypothetical protein